MLFRRKSKIDFDNLPQHIAFIMDGNGRWAKQRGLPRTFGHKVGCESVVAVIKHANELGIKYLSFFAFSTENWNRPKNEVDEIFRLVQENLFKYKDDFLKKNYKLCHMGELTNLPQKLQEEITDCVEKSKNNTGMVINVAFNYGGRSEIVRAANLAIEANEKLTEQNFAKYLYTSSIPDPDLVIRTSREYRLSNFMLYQIAYSELYFPSVNWPAFREKQLDEAIINYQQRSRRFGRTQEQLDK